MFSYAGLPNSKLTGKLTVYSYVFSAEPVAAVGGGATPSVKTLSENAEDFMSAKSAQKRKYDEVEVTTGEENEFNVIQTRAR